jgi:hypothetical protein
MIIWCIASGDYANIIVCAEYYLFPEKLSKKKPLKS